MDEFSPKDRRRLRQFLELAHSTEFVGERDAAISAATRLAEAHGMSLREAVGMSAEDEEKAARVNPANEPPHRHPTPDPMDVFSKRFGFRMKRPSQEHAAGFRTEEQRDADDKRKFDEALAEARRRGLDAAEIRQAARRKRDWMQARKRSKHWRPRSEFVRVLLKETQMTAREIALTAGVSVYEVFREKLLLRRAAAA
jgi:hypothetical protein